MALLAAINKPRNTLYVEYSTFKNVLESEGSPNLMVEMNTVIQRALMYIGSS